MKNKIILSNIPAYILSMLSAVMFLLCISSFVSGYSSVTEKLKDCRRARTVIQYAMQKAAFKDAITGICQMDGQKCMFLQQEYGKAVYLTYFYQYDGYFCELTTSKNSNIPLSAGTKLLPVDRINFYEAKGRLTKLSVTCGSENMSAVIACRKKGKGV